MHQPCIHAPCRSSVLANERDHILEVSPLPVRVMGYLCNLVGQELTRLLRSWTAFFDAADATAPVKKDSRARGCLTASNCGWTASIVWGAVEVWLAGTARRFRPTVDREGGGRRSRNSSEVLVATTLHHAPTAQLL